MCGFLFSPIFSGVVKVDQPSVVHIFYIEIRYNNHIVSLSFMAASIRLWGFLVDFGSDFGWIVTKCSLAHQAFQLGVRQGWKLIGINGIRLSKETSQQLQKFAISGKTCTMDFIYPI